jgi:hypothetical protein
LQKANFLRFVLFAILGLVFLIGLIELLLLRFETGDVYPAYSSLRSDPLGTRVLHDSIEKINSSLVSRNYLQLQQLEFKNHMTFFYLGASVFDPEYASPDLLKLAEHLTHAGGRLVLSFMPIVKSRPFGARETAAI